MGWDDDAMAAASSVLLKLVPTIWSSTTTLRAHVVWLVPDMPTHVGRLSKWQSLMVNRP